RLDINALITAANSAVMTTNITIRFESIKPLLHTGVDLIGRE
ncbi:MAG: hypothetical protein ACI9FR_003439, partial [Cryomorphaceae bacterium]